MKSKEKELPEKINKDIKKLNLSFFILLIFFTQVILSDTIIYFSNIRYIFANAIAIILNIALVSVILKKKIVKIKLDFSKWDLIFFAILMICIIATIIFPDEFWDSYSYHIYLQQNPFADKINEDFFPGRTLTSFVFPIADRIFTMFRSALGFRLGTLPGYLILIVIFYQIKKIIKQLVEKDIKELYLSILSILPLGTFIILQQLGTYYIDNFSIVILLEFTYTVLFESDEIFKKKVHLYCLAFIVGIGVCIKVTNAIYMLLPLIYVLIKNIKDIKQIKWYDYILLIMTAFIPMLPYFIDAIVQTGSPVFPYYNKIFKSEYFAQENWLDDRYGPKNLIQFLLWPIYIIKHPEKAYEVGKTDLSFATGYIFAIIYLLYEIYRKIVKKEKIKFSVDLIYVLNLIYFYIVWEKFIIGYTRYAGVIAILSTILIIKMFIQSVEKQHTIKILLLAGLLCGTAYQGIYQYVYYGSGYNYVLVSKHDENAKQLIKNNIKKLLKDRVDFRYDINGIWGVIYDDSAVPMMLNVDDKLVHLERGNKTGKTEKSDEIYWKNVLENDIYVPLYSFKLKGKLEYFDLYHFEVLEITDVITDAKFLNGDQFIYIVKVRYNENVSSGNQERFEALQQVGK